MELLDSGCDQVLTLRWTGRVEMLRRRRIGILGRGLQRGGFLKIGARQKPLPCPAYPMPGLRAPTAC
jgi:hypothetical protein